jgi:hypothetical protein
MFVSHQSLNGRTEVCPLVGPQVLAFAHPSVRTQCEHLCAQYKTTQSKTPLPKRLCSLKSDEQAPRCTLDDRTRDPSKEFGTTSNTLHAPTEDTKTMTARRPTRTSLSNVKLQHTPRTEHYMHETCSTAVQPTCLVHEAYVIGPPRDTYPSAKSEPDHLPSDKGKPSTQQVHLASN